MENNKQESHSPRLNKRQLRRLQAVERIQSNALQADAPNRVSKTISFQQGLSILLRSQQLNEEGGGVSPEVKAKQMDACWKMRRVK